ncbi:MAG: hypothetical protein U1F83_08025 [Verrucomicrobiota bacterium]
MILAQDSPLCFELPAATPAEIVSAKTQPTEPAKVLTRDQLKLHERESIVAALKQCAGKVVGVDGAAELLRMKPTTLASRIKALGIKR